MNVFVYGTLKANHANNWLMQRIYARPLCIGRAFGYSLVDLGSCPAMIQDDNGFVDGEIWEVDEEMVPVLDNFERQAYGRITIRVKTKRDPKLEAEAYLLAFRPRAGVKRFSKWKGK